MIIQDASLSLVEAHEELASRVGDLLSSWADSYDHQDIKLGFASFTDKPVPLRGWGPLFATWWKAIDTCYDLGLGLSTNTAAVKNAFHSMTVRKGGDLRESQLEALMYTVLDPRVGYTPPSTKFRTVQSHSADGNLRTRAKDETRLITRIAVVITDDISHLEGDAMSGINQYNKPRSYEAGTYGGWGSPGLASFPAAVWINGTLPWTSQCYEAFWNLMYYEDMGYPLTVVQKELLRMYKAHFGPSSWDPVVEHDGKYSEDSCATKDYPSLEQVKSALVANDVLPIILVTNPDGHQISSEAIDMCVKDFGYLPGTKGTFDNPDDYVRCVVDIYRHQFKTHGIEGLVDSFKHPEDVYETLKGIVVSLSNYNCDQNDAADTTDCEHHPLLTSESTEFPLENNTLPDVTPGWQTAHPVAPTNDVQPPIDGPDDQQTTNPIVVTDLDVNTDPPHSIIPTSDQDADTDTDHAIIPPTNTDLTPSLATTPLSETVSERTTQPATEDLDTTVSVVPSPVLPTLTGEVELTTPQIAPIITIPEHTDGQEGSSPVQSTEEEENSPLPVGVIIGSAAGGLAGLAVLGGLLYKGIQSNWFGGSSTPELGPATGPPGEDITITRDELEELTADMFL